MEFWGYSRPDGSVGVRNHVLILPATRNVNYICHRIALAVPGVTTFYTTGEYGRTGGDRKRLARFLTGIARNSNTRAAAISRSSPPVQTRPKSSRSAF